MSSKLSSVLVQAGAVPVRKVEEAIQRQVIYGGSLGTNLLEMGALEEEQLRLHLCRAAGLPPADYRWIRASNAEALKLFPRKLIERYRMIPVAVQGSTLVAMVAESLEPSVIEELSFMLSLEIRPHVMPEIRYMEALESYLGIPLRPRYRNLLRKLDAGLAPKGAELRSYSEEVRIEQQDRRPSQPGRESGTLSRPAVGGLSPRVPLELAALAAGVPASALAATLSPPAAATPTAPTPAVPMPAAPTPPSAPPPAAAAATPAEDRTLTPRTTQSGAPSLAEAITQLDRQEQRDGLLAVVFSYLASRLENLYSFVVRSDGIRAFQGRGAGIERFEGLTQLTFPVPETSLIGGVCRSCQHYLGPVEQDEATGQFYGEMGRSSPAEALLLPVVVRERTVMLLLADNDGRSIEPAVLPEVMFLVQRLAQGLQRLILAQKRQGGGQLTTPSLPSMFATPVPAAPTGRAPSPAATPPAQMPAPLATPAPAPAPSPVAPGPPAETRPPTGPHGQRPAPGEGDDDDDPGTVECPTLPVMAAVRLGADGAPPTQPEGRKTSRPEMARLVDTLESPVGDLPASTPEPGQAGGTPIAVPTSPIIELTRIVRKSPTPATSVSPTPETAAALLAGMLETKKGDAAASERRSITAWVGLLGDEEKRNQAMAELRGLGLSTLEGLMHAFPGPILVDRESLVPGRFPPVEEHGPVLALLVDLGLPALSAITREVESTIIANRFYATLLLGRSGDKGAVGVIAERLYDPVGLVRQAAREALTPFLRQEGFATVRARISSDIMLGEGDHVRWAAESAAWFRNTEAVEPLILLLKNKDPQLREIAASALRKITLQDYGTAARPWTKWYEKNEHRDRIEWLIEALVHEERDLRGQAAQELHRITGVRIPFDINGPRKEWKRVQNDWWKWYRGETD